MQRLLSRAVPACVLLALCASQVASASRAAPVADSEAGSEARTGEFADGNQDPPAEPEPPDEPERPADYAYPTVDPGARLVQYGPDPSAFRPPVPYADTFRHQEQLDTYGDKMPVPTQHPLRIGGRPLYREGELGEGINLIGSSNLLFPHLLVYGDWRTAGGYNQDDDGTRGRIATRINLDIDLGLTATERIHAFMRPLDRNGQFTGFDFAGRDKQEDFRLDGNLDALFFEGDLGAMFRGPGAPSIPIAIGKMPLLFQNGVWVEDAFTGVAVSWPAKNSPRFDIANYDLTFFAAFDDVTTGAQGPGEKESDLFLLGATTFLEMHEGFWELGYGYTSGSGASSDIDYHNLTAAFSRRYGAWLSNSVRAIWNVGQSRTGPETADGLLLLAENSLITSRPYTFVPYFNAFLGFRSPQSLARDGGAGGVLKNTGINFEADAQTGYPSLDPNGHDALGGALGVEYLFGGKYGVANQVVLEAAGQVDHGSRAKSAGNEFAIGARVQVPLSHRFILRFDAMHGWREDGRDIYGFRVEFRWKF